MPGVPGGIERHVEELYPRLAKLGVDVTVYARREYVPEDCVIDGVRVVTLPSLRTRYGEALSHTARSIIHASRGGFDLLHMHAIGPGVLIPQAKLSGLRPVVLTFHSFDYRRSKWGPASRAFLRACETVSITTADALIAVSAAGAEHIRKTYDRPVAHIPNGPGKLEPRPPGRLLRALRLEERRYLLSVGRLSPEKCLEDVIAAASRGLPGIPLVLVGDTSFTGKYVERLRTMDGPDVIFPGYLHGADLEELYTSALAYVVSSEIEGLSLSLLEAMAAGCPIIASDIPGNREGLGDPPAGLTYPVHDVPALASHLRLLVHDAELRDALAAAAQARVRSAFNWDAIAATTLVVYEGILDAACRAHHR